MKGEIVRDSLSVLTFEESLPRPRFREIHQRVVPQAIETVWPQCLAVTAKDVRAVGPLFVLRGLPARLIGKRTPAVSAPQPLLDVFLSEGFVLLRRDDMPRNGRAIVIFGAAGRFWSLTGNAPIRFTSPAQFLGFATPGYAKTAARLEAIDLGDGTTRVETETRVVGTDTTSTRKFAPYWWLIRLFSGLIRRSWLAAIARRAAAHERRTA